MNTTLRTLVAAAALVCFSTGSFAQGKGGGSGGGSNNGGGGTQPASLVSDGKCTLDSYSITGAIPSAALGLSGGVVPPLPSRILSSMCVGMVSDPKSPDPYQGTNPNLGWAGDGLLNGAGGLLSPTQFISSSQLLDLKGDGKADDPGWIKLGSVGSNSGSMTATSITTPSGSSFNIGSVVQYSQVVTNTTGGIQGTWQLSVDKDVKATLEAAGIFERSYFDHLAFVVKAGNIWAIYDFDFNLFPGFDLSTPYTLTGAWNLFDFPNGSGNGTVGISGIEIWARDPITRVPEPASALLLGAALLGLGAAVRRRKNVAA